MLMVIIGMFQGALLFAGLALAFNVLVFTSTNWGFIFLITLIGAVVGTFIGFLLRPSEPSNVWALPLGSLVVAMVVAIFGVAFDFFIFGDDNMHWRGITSLSLIASGPGLIAGWMLAQQFAGEEVASGGYYSSLSGSAEPSSRSRSQQEPFAPPRQPLPMAQNSAEIPHLQTQQLAQVLNSEISQFPPDVQVDAPQKVGESSNMCVTAIVHGRGQMLKLYFVCSPDYPHEPPQLMVEQIDQLQGSSHEVRYRSKIIQNWNSNHRLYEVVNQIRHDFIGR
jgi:hypothetical protein